jgi:cysteine desulfurase
MANWLDCSKNQIFFTSGSTESANWVIQTFAPRYLPDKLDKYIYSTSKLEHPAVKNSLGFMQKCGYPVF